MANVNISVYHIDPGWWSTEVHNLQPYSNRKQVELSHPEYCLASFSPVRPIFRWWSPSYLIRGKILNRLGTLMTRLMPNDIHYRFPQIVCRLLVCIGTSQTNHLLVDSALHFRENWEITGCGCHDQLILFKERQFVLINMKDTCKDYFFL